MMDKAEEWSGYVDDSILVASDAKLIESAFSVIGVHEKAKVNYYKTEASLWLGSHRGRTVNPPDMNWHNEVVKVLGVHFDNTNTNELIWRQRIDKLKNKTNPVHE